MAKKKSVKKAAKQFGKEVDLILSYVGQQPVGAGPFTRWAYEYAIIRLYREFENLVLHALVGAINNDSTTLQSRLGFRIPRHMTDEFCTYLVVGDRYFDFKGRDGLIGTIKRFVPMNHYLLSVVEKQGYRVPLERLCALRNFAAHGSAKARTAAKRALGVQNLKSAGSWLSRQQRFAGIAGKLKDLSGELETGAPY